MAEELRKKGNKTWVYQFNRVRDRIGKNMEPFMVQNFLTSLMLMMSGYQQMRLTES